MRQNRPGECRRWRSRLAAAQVYVAPRVGRMRISPHVYNDEEDVDRFLAKFRTLTRASH
jgi:selenocysteine lyase/cysteine desulfurase